MKMNLFWMSAGFVVGLCVAYHNESEIDAMCRKSRRVKRKAMKAAHKAYDNVCDCLDFD
ncbi:MAG: hypothetical protein K2L08_03995 [Erysipelotrichaceae bacterium]|nr:hypothetical protein [Erysipelotrichaceae bacterium]